MPGDTKYDRRLAQIRAVAVVVALAIAAIAYFVNH
jgi:hypothetical protein